MIMKKKIETPFSYLISNLLQQMQVLGSIPGLIKLLLVWKPRGLRVDNSIVV